MKWSQRTVAILSVFGFAVCLVNAACLGYWLRGLSTAKNSADPFPVVLKADSASAGKAVSMATGRIDTDIEGVFALDHLTGNLFCSLLSPRTGQQVGLFSANVAVMMGDRVGDPDYVMTTGSIELGAAGRVGNMRPAQCVVYVAEGNTGRVLAYTLQFDRQRLQTGVAQEGALQLIWQGSIRAAGIKRD